MYCGERKKEENYKNKKIYNISTGLKNGVNDAMIICMLLSLNGS